MNNTIDINKIINKLTSNTCVQKKDFFIGHYCINYSTLIQGDVDYLCNFLHTENQTDNILITYYIYAMQLESDIKNILLNSINVDEDIIIQNHIIDSHYSHTFADMSNNIINVYYSDKMMYFILEIEHTYIIMYDEFCKNQTTLPLYIVREIVYRNYENNNFVCFHAASCQLSDIGVMLIGNSGCGKTGLLLGLLECQESLFVSNDRVLISDSLQMCTLPMPIRVSPSSVSNSKVLSEYIIKNINNLCRKLNFDQIIDIKSDERKLKQKIELSPLEISHCFNKNFIDMSILKVIIVPEFCNEELGNIEINQINEKDLMHTLKNNCYTPKDPLWVQPWFFRKHIDRNDVCEYIDVIKEKVPAFRVRYSSDVHIILKQKSSDWFIKKIFQNYNKRLKL